MLHGVSQSGESARWGEPAGDAAGEAAGAAAGPPAATPCCNLRLRCCLNGMVSLAPPA